MEHYAYLVENASQETAERFLANVKASFTDLSRQTKMGAPLILAHPDLAGMRKWQVKGFDNVLTFYLPRQDGISVVRVLHAAQDWWQLLGIGT